MHYFLHSHSAVGQFHAHDDAAAELEDMVRRFDAIFPLIEKGLAYLVVDERLESTTSLISGHPFLSLVNRLKHGLVVRWFIYTKNRSKRLSAPLGAAKFLDLPQRAEVREGDVLTDMLVERPHWLSFSGTITFTSSRIEIRQSGNTHDQANSSSFGAMTATWPRYERSPKHRLEEYVLSGELVSAMDLDDIDAQGALLTSIEHRGNKFAIVREKYYRFLATNVGSIPQTYHGFRVRREDVPANVLHAL